MSSKCKPSTSQHSLKRAGTLIRRSKTAKAARFTQPKLNLKKLSEDLGKDFPDPIKSVLAVDAVYQILSCKVFKDGKYDTVLLVEVASPNDVTKVISTYFSALYTKELINKVAYQGINLEKSPEVLEGFTFSYLGETESCQGHFYSKINFCSEEEQSDEEVEEIDD